MEREPRLESEGLTDAELAELLSTRLDSWNFAEHSDEDNFQFAFGMAYCLTEVFDQINFGTEKNIPGHILPPALEPLARHTYRRTGETFYDEDLIIRAERRDEDVVIPGKSLDARQFKNFEDMVTQVKNSPELQAQITKDEIIPNPVVQLSLDHRPSSDWGLTFAVYEDKIILSAFGEQGKTQSASDFIVTYHDKPRVLAQTVSQLAVLGAKFVLWARQDYRVSLDEVESIIARAFRI